MQLTFLGVISWVAFIFIEEIARLFGKPLTKQEATIIMLATGVISMVTVSTGFVYRAYFRQSDAAVAFGIAEYVPGWYSPPAIIERTLFRPYWFLPVALSLSFTILTIVANIAMGWFTKILYVDVERLPFPLQEVSANAILTLTSRESRPMRVFIAGIDIGLAAAFVIYGFPMVGDALGFSVPSLSSFVPWVDLNVALHRMGLRGASLGVNVDPALFATGLVVPFAVVSSMFIGSFALYFIGNVLLVNLSITDFAKEWFEGMSLTLTMQRSILHAWISPTIGMLLAAGMMPLIRHPRLLVESFRGLSVRKRGGHALTSLYGLLAVWLGASLASVALVYYLVPGYPVWIMLFFSVGWSLFWSIVTSRAIGLVGTAPNPPGILNVMKYGYISLSGYSGIDIWFIDPVISLGGSSWCASFKVAELCETSPASYVKAYLLAIPVALTVSFLCVDRFWSVAPMPSAVYAGTATFWPLEALSQSIWITGAQRPAVIRPAWILGGFGIAAVLFLFADFLRLPISVIGLATGSTTFLPLTLTILIGGIAGRISQKIFGTDRWNKEKSVLAGGIMVGEALVMVFATAALMIARSIWILPY